MNTFAHLGAGLFLAIVALSGCSQVAAPDDEASVADQDIQRTEAAGKYESGAAAGGYAATVKDAGGKLTVQFEGETFDLKRTASGVYVFTSDELSGACDDPGCRWLQKVSGVLYTKNVEGASKATLKLQLEYMYEHPESEGDFEGVDKMTVHLFKK